MCIDVDSDVILQGSSPISEGNRRGKDERWCVKEGLRGPGPDAGCHAADKFTESQGRDYCSDDRDRSQ